MKIKDARKDARYTQESLILEINKTMKCTLRNYQNIEYGLISPSVTLVLLICDLLGVDPTDIDEWKITRRV